MKLETEKDNKCVTAQKEFADILQREIVQKNLNIHWNDIADLEETKKLLNEV